MNSLPVPATEVRLEMGSRPRLLVLIAASALALLAGWNTGDLGPVADPLARSYHVSLPTVGILITAIIVVHTLSQVPAGSWTDRLGARKAALVAVGILVVGNLILGVAPIFGLALVIRALMGAGTALAFLAGSNFLRLAGDSPLAQGWLGGMGIGGGGLAIAFVPRVMPFLSWRSPYATALAMAALTLLTLALAPPTRPAAGIVQEGFRRVMALRDPLLYRLALIHCGSMGVSVIASSWAVPFLTRRGYGIEEAGAAASLLLLGGVVSRPLGGWLQRARPGWTAPLVLGSAITAAAGMAVLVQVSGLLGPLLGSTLVGFATGLPFGLVFNEAARAQPERPTMAVGFVNMIGNLVVVVGTPLLGLAFLLREGPGVGFLALACLGALCAVALPGLRLPPPEAG